VRPNRSVVVICTAIGVLVGATVMAVFTHRQSAVPQVAPTPATTIVASQTTPQPSRPEVAPVQPGPAATPVTPSYGPRVEEPQSIYRCKSKGTTTYSNEPCANGTIVDESSAVSGFDSRPSKQMEQLVSDGRANTYENSPPVQSRRSVATNAATDADGTECATLRQQIVDIDNYLRYPNSARTLDYWRQVRQDIRTSMTRKHC